MSELHIQSLSTFSCIQPGLLVKGDRMVYVGTATSRRTKSKLEKGNAKEGKTLSSPLIC